VEECRSCPVFASFALAFALQLRKKHGKTSVMVRKTSEYSIHIHIYIYICVYIYIYTVYILYITPTHYYIMI